ncbi:MAG TPA: DUF5327 family protein [Pseudogracilibacillus sp.]|nr:DUF5327 family protein [Pseudogracilibacillus sp.]
MNVSSKTIIDKMAAEVAQAKRERLNEAAFLRRVAKIKVLCELLLDESTHEDGMFNIADHLEASPEEMEQMMGISATDTDEDDGTHDPKSIFDF